VTGGFAAMSRAFVKEADEELASYREDSSYNKKNLEWLKIQEKKLNFLKNDPKAQEIEPSKRERWIREIEEALSNAKQRDSTEK
jgi:epoxyqueuosine reductase QueG